MKIQMGCIILQAVVKSTRLSTEVLPFGASHPSRLPKTEVCVARHMTLFRLPSLILGGFYFHFTPKGMAWLMPCRSFAE